MGGVSSHNQTPAIGSNNLTLKLCLQLVPKQVWTKQWDSWKGVGDWKALPHLPPRRCLERAANYEAAKLVLWHSEDLSDEEIHNESNAGVRICKKAPLLADFNAPSPLLKMEKSKAHKMGDLST